jgi:sugar lactone lactonase YvrE
MGVYGTNRVSESLQNGSPINHSACLIPMKVIFDPTGKHLKDIEFSGKNLTCPTWGGKNLDILFVTSAKDPIICIKDGDEGGNMFKYMVRNGPKGKPKFDFAG